MFGIYVIIAMCLEVLSFLMYFFITATAFRETVDAVLPEGVTLYPIIDSCCGGGFKMGILRQYPKFRNFRNNRARIIVITASDTTQADTYDDFWLVSG
jgi:hypothetical protein